MIKVLAKSLYIDIYIYNPVCYIITAYNLTMELKVYMIDVSHSVVQSSVHFAFHLPHSVPLS